MDRNTQQNEKLQTLPLLTNNRARLWSSVIIDALVKGGVKNFYLSPGMRNAPLIAALQKRSDVRLYVVIDERASAYRALGASKVSGETSCLICTSGTALANYLPALIEAKKTNIALLAISADRPPELTFSDANQTIHQNRLFSGADIYSHSLQAPNDQVSLKAIVGEVLHVLTKTRHPTLTPVHLNIPFREPLDHRSEEISPQQLSEAQSIMAMQTALVRDAFPNQSLAAHEEEYLKTQLAQAKNPLLVVGGLSPYQIGPALKSWVQNFKGPKVLDAGSSLKYLYPLNAGGVPTLEHQEIQKSLETKRPDLILHLGGRLTSKFYYEFLERNPEIPLFVASSGTEREDPSFRVSYRYHGELENFARDLLPVLKESSHPHLSNFEAVVAKKEQLIDQAPPSYPVLSKTILEMIPDGSALYLGNSTVIRSFDSYASATLKKDLMVLTNRGVSGIEGIIASAVGARDRLNPIIPLTVVNGDIATLHDLNSLFMLRECEAQIIYIIANNSCGGIFSLLPVAQESQVADIIRSPRVIDYSKAQEFLNLTIKRAHTKSELAAIYQDLLETRQSAIIDFVFSDDDNTRLYQQLKTVR